MLELCNVTKRYSGIPAVDNVSFTARPGQITGYLGANGSGKSTTMKLITGLIGKSSGEILFQGCSIHKDIRSYKRQIGYVPEEPHLYNHLSGEEFLVMVAQLRQLEMSSARNRIHEMLRLFLLHDDRFVSMSSYSKGMRQRILLIAALLHDPKLVLLDEPFSGLDVTSSLILRSLIEELANRGKAVLLSSHELQTVEALCSRVVIIHRGRVVADDSVEQLRQLMKVPTLEEIFSLLAIQQDTRVIARQLADLMRS